MKFNKILGAAIGVTMVFMAGPVLAETCCQKAAAAGKECKDKCCIAAHKEGKSCVKCNPNKEDLKLKRTGKNSAKDAKSDKRS